MKPIELKLAWLFPGQGAQSVGMGKDVFEASPKARAAFDEADHALGEGLSKLCFDGPSDQLTLTANTQPAIVATSVALLRALLERYPDLKPDYAAGHSLGEYSALCAAGALTLTQAVKVTRVRGRAMQQAVPPGQGAMAAVMSLSGDDVSAICAKIDGVVSCANFNAPIQTVIAGEAGSVEAAGRLAKEAGGKVIPLNVSAPFHCALMEPAKAAVREALESAEVKAPSIEILHNVDAAPRGDAAGVIDALVAQVSSPVQWVKTVQRLRELGCTHALEIGPGRVLAGLGRRIDKGLKILSVGSVEAIEKVDSFLEVTEAN